ncbi:prolyl endopeptidase [Coccinella septempunctata]|uniref:prolyl endopeptidase n=1 Tax=Coccinella septempunctata TaxID=41139 RepID=UPI001D090A9B|nr:prolyl endopeptidase [Coccinella septempunctata]
MRIKYVVIKRFFADLRTGITKNSSNMNTTFAYPLAKRDETVVENFFGTEIKDPYRWLEAPDASETKQFVELQNNLTMPFLNECQYKESIREKITKLWNYPKVSNPFLRGSFYFQYRNSGLQNQSVIYKMKELHSEGEVFLDPNTLAEDGTIALQASAFSEDGKTFAYGISRSGSDWLEVKFRDVETGNDYNETLKKVRYSSLTWMKDNIGFFYGGYLDQKHSDGTEIESSENQKLYYHKLGTSQDEDVVVVKFEDPHLRMGASVSYCGNYLVVTPVKGCKNNLLYIGKLEKGKQITGEIPLQPIVETFNADYEYITNDDDIFYFKTNRNAPNYHIIAIDLKNCSEDNWKVIIPQHEKDVIDDTETVGTKYFIISKLHDVKHILHLYEISTGKLVHEFKLDLGTIMHISCKRKHNQMFYSFCSYLTPCIIYQVDFEGKEIKQKVYHETVVGDFERNNYETKQVFYESKDGTKIPMFLVAQKGKLDNPDGDTPVWLYGYGGFNVSLTPSFGVSKLIFTNNFRGIYALANIRGGGEYGDKWHDGGRFENKQNCFDDFQYAAKYLIENRHTNSKKIVIQGGSNGGLLIAACINQAPELFGAAICQVGVLDMLRYHKFTIGHAWKTDYGCSSEEDQFKYLIKYSPLHNIFEPNEEKQYPSTLLLTADHDDRVVPLHSLKFIAELQRKAGTSPHQKNPLLIRLETKAGHGSGKPTSKMIEELTDIFCFVSKTLNIPFYS